MTRTIDSILDQISKLGVRPTEKDKLRALRIQLPMALSCTTPWKSYLATARLAQDGLSGDRPANLRIFGMPVVWAETKEPKVEKI